jgi:hypothetical protein
MGWGGFGFVHHSRTLFCRAVPSPNLTIRNFCIAVSLQVGELHVTGFVRGGALCADQLVHLAGHDYQIKRIQGPTEPCKFR